MEADENRCPTIAHQAAFSDQAPVKPRIETTPGIAGGKPRIAGHRITVEDIVIWHRHQGKCSAQIADEFDLTPSEVHAALAYYRDHRAVMDRAMELGRQYVDACRSRSTSKVTEKLRQRKRSRDEPKDHVEHL